MDLVDCFHGIEVVNSGIKSNFIHDDDPGFPRCCIELTHGRRDVTRCNNMSLSFDSGANNIRMVCIRNQGDNEIICRYFSLKGGGIGDIEGKSGSVRKPLPKSLGLLERAAS